MGWRYSDAKGRRTFNCVQISLDDKLYAEVASILPWIIAYSMRMVRSQPYGNKLLNQHLMSKWFNIKPVEGL